MTYTEDQLIIALVAMCVFWTPVCIWAFAMGRIFERNEQFRKTLERAAAGSLTTTDGVGGKHEYTLINWTGDPRLTGTFVKQDESKP